MPGSVPDLATAKARLGIRTAARDAEISQLLAAAIEHVEDLTGHLLIRRAVTRRVSASGRSPIRIHVGPVHALFGARSLAADGSPTAVAGAFLATALEPPQVLPAEGSAWPTGYGLEVEVDAGYDPGQVPEQLIQAVLLLVGHWFENHEAVVVGTTAVELPIGVKDLCRNFREPGFE